MLPPKDLFSTQSKTYAAFRPHYPQLLFDYLFSLVKNFDHAWDCGTGNGQVAVQLAKRFAKVEASDISASQIEHATRDERVNYVQCRAEATPFADASFDLITVATAIHWFDFDLFYKEVRRVAKPGAMIAVWAYAPPVCDPKLDQIMHRFSMIKLKDYWNPERRYVDEDYKTIPFPFEEIKTPQFEIDTEWTMDQYIGYIQSWSSVQNYKQKHGVDPVPEVAEEIRAVWEDAIKRQIVFPLFVRCGEIN
jgi:ubiquinone/menaquinone biosynthesis C-methylase UbiE